MKTIKLKPNGTGRYDDVSPFIMPDGRLDLKIILPNVNGEFYFVTENNGRTEKKLLPSSGEIALEVLTAGELFAEIKHYLKGELIKTYKVEPLILKEADGSITAEPEIAALTRENSRLAAIIAEESKRAQTTEKALNKAVCALIRFAYTDFCENVYLGGGTKEQFLDGFGFELSIEQMQEIFGGNDDD